MFIFPAYNVDPTREKSIGDDIQMKRIKLGREVWMLLYLPLYLLIFYLAERTQVSRYWITDCALDLKIPFVPGFVFAYVSWYPLMIGMTLWLLVKDRRTFIEYGWMVILGLSASLATFFLLPSAQNLRPVVLEGNGLAERLVSGIYAVDTNTNVFPSMHVVGTLAAMCAAFRSSSIRPTVKWGIALLGLMINVSTLLIKQHAILDMLGGLIYFAVVYLLVCVLPQCSKNRKRCSKMSRRAGTTQL